MKWIREINEILKDEPEQWLAYIHGQKIDKIPRLTEEKPKYTGLFFRILLFLYYLCSKTALTRKPASSDKKGGFFVYAGSINQMNSLDSTIDALREMNQYVQAVAPRKFINNSDRASRYTPYNFSVFDTLCTVELFFIRVTGLYRTLKKRHNSKSIDWYFNNFCKSYAYLVYFYNFFQSSRPDFVITSNDHNVPNRCMLAVAHKLSIKTVYMQHASVSSLFPALRVNYAFLDGLSALQVYRTCESNIPRISAAPIPEVFLSGQKKKLSSVFECEKEGIGVAINALDRVDDVIHLVRKLSILGKSVVLRWHPAQPADHVKRYSELFKNDLMVSMSDPNKDGVDVFFSKIQYLVAGNSSIHLEASTLGIKSFYYESAKSSTPDYYGYVANGLIPSAGSIDDLLALLEASGNKKPATERVRYYSATYGTPWFGREGELVADSLVKIKNTGKASDCFGRHEFFEDM